MAEAASSLPVLRTGCGMKLEEVFAGAQIRRLICADQQVKNVRRECRRRPATAAIDASGFPSHRKLQIPQGAAPYHRKPHIVSHLFLGGPAAELHDLPIWAARFPERPGDAASIEWAEMLLSISVRAARIPDRRTWRLIISFMLSPERWPAEEALIVPSRFSARKRAGRLRR